MDNRELLPRFTAVPSGRKGTDWGACNPAAEMSTTGHHAVVAHCNAERGSIESAAMCGALALAFYERVGRTPNIRNAGRDGIPTRLKEAADNAYFENQLWQASSGREEVRPALMVVAVTERGVDWAAYGGMALVVAQRGKTPRVVTTKGVAEKPMVAGRPTPSGTSWLNGDRPIEVDEDTVIVTLPGAWGAEAGEMVSNAMGGGEKRPQAIAARVQLEMAKALAWGARPGTVAGIVLDAAA